MKDFTVLLDGEKKVVVWGTGGFSKSLFPYLQQITSISYYLDNDPLQRNREMNGILIFSPTVLVNEDKDRLVILIASSYYEQIEQQLMSEGFEKNQILCGDQSFILKNLRILARNVRLNDCSEYREEKINLYRNIFTLFSPLQYRNIQISKLLNVEICILLDYLLSPRIKSTLNEPPGKLFFNQTGCGGILGVSTFQGRDDHLQLLISAVKQIPRKNLTFFTIEEHESSHIFIPSCTPETEKKFTGIIESCLEGFPIRLNSYEKDWLVRWILVYISYIDFVYEFLINNKFEVLISVGEVTGFQNAFYQWMKLLNKKTMHLQHGLITPMNCFAQNQEKMPLTEISFTQCISDTYLVWGNGFKQSLQTQGIHPDSVFVVGNPKYDFTLSERGHFFKDSLFTYNLIGLFLPTPAFESADINKKMIEITLKVARLYNSKVIIKTHPHDMTNYEDIIDGDKDLIMFAPKNATVQSILQRIDFLIISASTVFFESSLFATPVFVYHDETGLAISDFLEDNLETKFGTAEELTQLVGHYSKHHYELNDFIRSINEKYMEVGEIRSSDACKKVLYICCNQNEELY